MRHCEKKHIKNQSRRISEEKLNFKDGIALGEVDIFIDGGKTRNKVRRIIEKRVSQDYWKQSGRKYPDNHSRFKMRHHASNHMKNIYGSVPCGFYYAA
jgi:hypothetical protein